MSKKLVLFMHGLGGSKDTWGEFPNIIANDSGFGSEYDIEFCKYDTSLLLAKAMLPYGGVVGKVLATFAKGLPNIQDISRQLKSKIKEQYNHYEEIYLVVHSMGGLV